MCRHDVGGTGRGPSLLDVSNDPLPFGNGDDPFGGLPIFGDLARLFAQQGNLGWDAARQLALSVATDGGQEPNVDPLERIRFESLARVAELQIGAATGLPSSRGGLGITITPVTRGQWVTSALEAWRPLFEALAGSLQAPDANDAGVVPGDPLGFLAPLMKMVGPMMLGMTAGSMVGHLARRCFGQYDLPIPRGTTDELLVLPANLDTFGEEWSLPPDDLRLWICLQEVAVHSVLLVGHVRARLDELLLRYVSSFEPDPGALEQHLGELDLSDPSAAANIEVTFSDPQMLLGAMQSPAQRDLLPGFEALVAVIVGYVDHIMDLVGGTMLSNYSMLAEALRRRRVEADTSDRFVERLFGLELTQATYDRGADFIAGVVERAGTEGLARLWESERTLPTPNELDAPGLWLARIELPES
jgi:putative hydrolase